MSTSNRHGFTIIETVLFLSISGLLILTILGSTGTAINNQRYRDSVTSLQAYFQDQYSEVMSVRNEKRTTDIVCNSSAVVTPGIGVGRGQGDCVLLGKYLTSSNGKTIESSTVVGDRNNATTATDDITELLHYSMNVLPSSTQSTELEWGSVLERPRSTNPQQFSVLILRSPLSGVARTFINSSASVPRAALKTLITTSALSRELKACVSAGGGSVSKKTAVTITAGTTSGSGVKIAAMESSGC